VLRTLAALLALVAPPPFVAHVERVSASDLRYSWRPGCPVEPADLRRLRVSYWGFDGTRRAGALVVHRSVTEKVASVFRRLYDARFPLRRVRTVDAYRGSDDASMAADNTSAFNCRYAVASGPRRWSVHAYGQAIDVNPVENPYLLERRVLPPAGRFYLDRARHRPGMAVAGGVLVQAFAAVGWSWGGRWSAPDYQHFSATGR
jgi:D-alanyl-D-alanine carboxypeptidase